MIFVTQYDKTHSGPDIEANSWAEAEAEAAILGVEVKGELVATCKLYNIPNEIKQ